MSVNDILDEIENLVVDGKHIVFTNKSIIEEPDLVRLVDDLRNELPLALHAVLMGGHVRVGFEDNIFFRKGILAESNAQLVDRVARLSREVGRETASPAEARQILGLSGILT